MGSNLRPDVRQLATRVRLNAVRMVAIQGFGYLGQVLSSAEIFASLFASAYRHGKDRFVLSPGHYAVGLYAVAAEMGLIPNEKLLSYGLDGAELEAIGTERTPIADLICGSLGQGLSGAIGFALASNMAVDQRDTYVFLSDGEMEEGQIWEAAMFAAHHHRSMSRLVVVIDANNSQVDGSVTSVTTIEPLADKWAAFGWHVIELDGHDCDALCDAFALRLPENKPLVVIARTEILGRLKSIPETVDGHFIKLDDALERAMTIELESALA